MASEDRRCMRFLPSASYFNLTLPQTGLSGPRSKRKNTSDAVVVSAGCGRSPLVFPR
jgi:hypothetical protein